MKLLHPNTYPLRPVDVLPGTQVLKGQAMDIVFLAGIAVFVGLTLALVAGCSALERRK